MKTKTVYHVELPNGDKHYHVVESRGGLGFPPDGAGHELGGFLKCFFGAVFSFAALVTLVYLLGKLIFGI